jgi:Predicted membrane protein
MSTKNCPYCGAPIAINASECQYCGAKLPVTPPQAPPQYAPPPPPQYAPPQYGYAPPQYGPPAYDPRMNTKSKVAAGLLALFLGGIGVHKFYLGQVGAGIVYLLFCWTGIPAIIGFVEGIIYLTSSDENFYYRYVKK